MEMSHSSLHLHASSWPGVFFVLLDRTPSFSPKLWLPEDISWMRAPHMCAFGLGDANVM